MGPNFSMIYLSRANRRARLGDPAKFLRQKAFYSKRLTNNYVETLHVCHSNIGKAVFYTTMTIIFGFSILVFSNFVPTIYFGVLTASAMFIALLAALTVLPKLILLWKPFG